MGEKDVNRFTLECLICHLIQGESWDLSVSTNFRLLFTYEHIHYELFSKQYNFFKSLDDFSEWYFEVMFS